MTIEAMKQALEALDSDNPDIQLRAATALRTAIEQAEKPVAWKNAAIRLGEELSSVGPDGYYNMTAEQWLDWAMDQQPRGKNSLNTLAAQRQWVGLTDEEIGSVYVKWDETPGVSMADFARAIEAKLKEKNT